MKRTILFLLVATLSVASISAQESRKTIYVIDGKQVENFDGSQLTGKTIINYSIDDEKNIHSIITSDLAGDKKVKSVKVLTTEKSMKTDNPITSNVTTDVIRANADEIIYVLDDKIVTCAEIKAMSSSNIDSMTVIKDKNNPVFQKFSQEYKKTSKVDPKCVILIATKK